MSAANQLSFLPEDYLALKAARRTNVICAVLFIAVIGGIGGFFYAGDQKDRAVNDRYAQMSREIMEKAKRIDQVKQMQDKQKTMAHQAELTSSLLEKVPRSYLLAEITNSMPTGVSLVEFTMDSRRRSAPAGPQPRTEFERMKMAELQARNGLPTAQVLDVPQYDVSMNMSGVAHTDVQITQFIAKLGASKLMKDVNLVRIEERKQGDEKLRSFQIEMTLNPNAEVQAAGNAKAASAAVDPMAR